MGKTHVGWSSELLSKTEMCLDERKYIWFRTNCFSESSKTAKQVVARMRVAYPPPMSKQQVLSILVCLFSFSLHNIGV